MHASRGYYNYMRRASPIPAFRLSYTYVFPRLAHLLQKGNARGLCMNPLAFTRTRTDSFQGYPEFGLREWRRASGLLTFSITNACSFFTSTCPRRPQKEKAKLDLSRTLPLATYSRFYWWRRQAFLFSRPRLPTRRCLHGKRTFHFSVRRLKPYRVEDCRSASLVKKRQRATKKVSRSLCVSWPTPLSFKFWRLWTQRTTLALPTSHWQWNVLTTTARSPRTAAGKETQDKEGPRQSKGNARAS